MKIKLFFLGVVVPVLLLGNFYYFSQNKELASQYSLASDKVLGVKASMTSLSSRIQNNTSTLDELLKNNGETLRNAYEREQEMKQKLFEQFEQINQDMLQAKKTGDEAEIERLKSELTKVVDLGDYSDVEFYRGSDWTMILYDNLPQVNAVVNQLDTIGIVDGKGRTVVLFQLAYDRSSNKFQLVSVDRTLEWLESTDVYQLGGSDYVQSESKENKKDEEE